MRKQERIDSEKTYLKLCVEDPLYQTYSVDNANNANFEKLYPRFQDLIAMYGAPIAEKKDSSSIAEDMFGLLCNLTTLTAQNSQLSALEEMLGLPSRKFHHL